MYWKELEKQNDRKTQSVLSSEKQNTSIRESLVSIWFYIGTMYKDTDTIFPRARFSSEKGSFSIIIPGSIRSIFIAVKYVTVFKVEIATPTLKNLSSNWYIEIEDGAKRKNRKRRTS